MEETQKLLSPTGVPEGSEVQPQHRAPRTGLMAVTAPFQLLPVRQGRPSAGVASFRPPAPFPRLFTWLSPSHFHYLC